MDDDAPEVSATARTRLMEEVAKQMDAIEAEFGDDFEIESTVIAVRFRRDDGWGLRVRKSPHMSPLEAVGILSIAQDIFKRMA